MSWQQYVQAAQAQDLGFTKVTIIARATYQTLASSTPQDIATAYDEPGLIDEEDRYKVIDNVSRKYMKGQSLPHIVKYIKEYYKKLYSVTMMNENQELLDDWMDINKKTFNFYGQKFNIIKRDKGEYYRQSIVCQTKTFPRECCIATQFKYIWFIAYKKFRILNKGERMRQAYGPNNSEKAYQQIVISIFDALEEADC